METIKRDYIACLWLGDCLHTKAIAEACYVFSPVLALRAHEAVFLDCTHGERPSDRDLLRVSEAWGVAACVGWGSSAAEALMRARFAGVSDLNVLPLEALVDVPSPFEKNDVLRQHVLEMVKVFRKLGLKCLGDLKHVPADSLASRFGETAGVLLRALAGDVKEAWPRFTPVEEVSESIDLSCYDDGLLSLSSLEPLFFILKKLSDRIFVRLRGRGHMLSALRLHLTSDDGRQREFNLTLPIPQSSVSGFLPILREKLAYDFQRQPLSAPLRALRMQVCESVDFKNSQRDIFLRREEARQSLEALLARLYARLNEDDLFYFTLRERYLPEKASACQRAGVGEIHTQAQATSAGETTLLNPRPSRLLVMPLRLSRQGHWLYSGEQRWQLVSWEGPERLSGEWWEESLLKGFARDYYRVTCTEGVCLWVFVSMPDENLYLHGYFD